MINLNDFYTEYNIATNEQAYCSAMLEQITNYLNSHNIFIHNDTLSTDTIFGFNTGKTFFDLIFSNYLDKVELVNVDNTLRLLEKDKDYIVISNNLNYIYMIELLNYSILENEKIKITYKKGISNSTPIVLQELIKQSILNELKNKNEKLQASNIESTSVNDQRYTFNSSINEANYATYKTVLCEYLSNFIY